jgi:hypothetical protein
MTVPRALLVIAMMVIIGVAVVVLRGESARAANRVQHLHHRQVVLEHDIWSRDMELARLRGPDAIRRRTSDLGLELVPPSAESKDRAATAPAPNQPE